MKKTLVIGVLAVLAFAVILIARLPASWIVPSSAASKIACADTDGTIWSGGCTGLAFQGQKVGDVTWVLHALPLLSGKAAAHVVLARSPGLPWPAHAEADVETGFSGKDITAHNLKADFAFDPSLAPQLHMPFKGNVHADLSQVQLNNRAVTQVQGEVQVHDLLDSGDNMELGNYALTFPGGPGEQTARLKDLGGPLAIEGTVRFTSEPGLVVDGLVAPRPTASQSLLNQLRVLGTPDAQGRRPFSFAATF